MRRPFAAAATAASTEENPPAVPQLAAKAENEGAALSVTASSSSLSKSTTTKNNKKDCTSTTCTTGLYVHIPFCRRRCRYCNFAIVPIGPTRTTAAASTKEEEMEEDAVDTIMDHDAMMMNGDGFSSMAHKYTNALLGEIRLISQTLTTNNNDNEKQQEKIPLRSIYFGGGTPSLAPIWMLRRVLEAILNSTDSPFAIDNNAGSDVEITIEMDPGTFSREKLRAVKDLGFNRISLGVQSFDDGILESLGRVHRYKDIRDSLDMLMDVFGDEDVNYSIDLISGLPGQSLALWAETLRMAVEDLRPRPKHMSLYDLQIEQGTVFGTWYASSSSSSSSDRGKKKKAAADPESLVGGAEKSASARRPLPLPSEDEAANMYKYASEYLRSKGYEHYEVSSYALLGDNSAGIDVPSPWRSRHNQIYWDVDGQWYALGLGATSYVGGKLTARPRTLADYIRWVGEQHQQQQRLMSTSSTSEKEKEDDDATNNSDNDDLDFLMDVVLKRLRTSEGLSLGWVKRRFPGAARGNAYARAILEGVRPSLELGLASTEVATEDDNDDTIIRLADPEGFLLSNSIISNIFAELEAL